MELARKLYGLRRVKPKVKTHIRNAQLRKLVKLLNAKFGKSSRRNISNEVNLRLPAKLQKPTNLSAIINSLFLGNLERSKGVVASGCLRFCYNLSISFISSAI